MSLSPPFARVVKHFHGFDAVAAFQPAGDGSCARAATLLLGRTMSRGYSELDMGAGRFRTRYEIGSVFLSRPNFANSIRSDRPHRIQFLQIEWSALKELDYEARLPNDGDFGATLMRTTNSAALNRLIDDAMAATDQTREALPAQSLLSDVVAFLVACTAGGAKRPSYAPERLSPRSAALAIQRLSCVELPPPSLNELATLCQLSPNHFCRAFRATVGMPPHRFQTLRRLERACQLLQHKDFAIADIAARVGYQDPAYFSRLFLREIGVSPTAWRAGADRSMLLRQLGKGVPA